MVPVLSKDCSADSGLVRLPCASAATSPPPRSCHRRSSGPGAVATTALPAAAIRGPLVALGARRAYCRPGSCPALRGRPGVDACIPSAGAVVLFPTAAVVAAVHVAVAAGVDVAASVRPTVVRSPPGPVRRRRAAPLSVRMPASMYRAGSSGVRGLGPDVAALHRSCPSCRRRSSPVAFARRCRSVGCRPARRRANRTARRPLRRVRVPSVGCTTRPCRRRRTDRRPRSRGRTRRCTGCTRHPCRRCARTGSRQGRTHRTDVGRIDTSRFPTRRSPTRSSLPCRPRRTQTSPTRRCRRLSTVTYVT